MAQLIIQAKNGHARALLNTLGASITLARESSAGFNVQGDTLTITGARIVVVRKSMELILGQRMSDADWQALVDTGVRAGTVVERSGQHFVVAR